jgi:uncharacterized membrane protein
MTFSMLPLLVHSEDLSDDLRETFRQALSAPPEERKFQLEAAAKALYREAGTLECSDVRALLGL